MEMSTLIPLESLKRYVKYTDGYSPALEVDDYIMAVGPYNKQVLPVSSPQHRKNKSSLKASLLNKLLFLFWCCGCYLWKYLTQGCPSICM